MSLRDVPASPRIATAASGAFLVGLALAASAEGRQPPTAPAPPAPPASAKSAADHPEDREALRALEAAFVVAFNKGDAAAVADLFVEEARILGPDGDGARGKEAIRRRFAEDFESDPGMTLALTPEDLDFLGPELAVEEGISTLTLAPAKDASAPSRGPQTTRYRVVYVKRGDVWRHAEVRDEFPGEVPHERRLAEIAWLVGDWVDESEDAVITSSCAWADGKSFLIRDFTIQIQGKPSLTGTQRIGWDPLTRQIKSWVFDSQGGYGEGLWTRAGDEWIIKATVVLRDGRVATATNVLTRVDAHTARWRSVDRTVGGELAPDLDEYTLVRKPPRPKGPS